MVRHMHADVVRQELNPAADTKAASATLHKATGPAKNLEQVYQCSPSIEAHMKQAVTAVLGRAVTLRCCTACTTELQNKLEDNRNEMHRTVLSTTEG